MMGNACYWYCFEKLAEEVGEQQFSSLLAQVVPDAAQIVEQALAEGLSEKWTTFS
jgi:hypothetical protein